MKFNHLLYTAILTASMSSALSAKENIGQAGLGTSGEERAINADCSPATAQSDLAINNVRATILAGGDMWWNLSNASYEIPKIPEGSNETQLHSLFAGSLWIGGIDAGGQLKVAAMTYRQTGNDFWPGPLNTSSVDISAEQCSAWDTHYKINRGDVEEFVAWQNEPDAYPGYSIPSSIMDWPAHGSAAEGQAFYLAPFFDVDADGIYNPDAGDYPDYDVTGAQGCDAKLYGDETLWWVFNDKGNIHSETGAESIGLEIHAQAFGFATNDEINNMTFYQYKVYNRSTFTLNDTYFGQWVDPDLGKYDDDFVGCDVARGLGYCYNGDENDDGATGYGLNPPAIGVDFFQGPLADAGDGIDNDRDGTIDEEGEQIIMSKFVYYNNDFTVTGNPETGTHIYNYLRGIFKDGTGMEYGGTGHAPSGTTTGISCDFMFPSDTDPDYWGTNGNPVANWSEVTEGNVPADRRFLQSAGAFTLEPGALNVITTGVVWARATQGGANASIDLMRLADDKAQALFDNCFQVLNGPDAPTLGIQELDQEIIFTLTNSTTSNNYLEQYEEFDPLIIAPDGEVYDTTYNFQGYQIYQLVDATVSITDVDNPDLVRLVAQYDVEDAIANLVNFEFDVELNANVPTMKVEGTNTGIQHSFKVTTDLFAQGDNKLVNHKPYYFTVIAYGYNSFKDYSQTVDGLDGQTRPYKAGRKNIRTYTAIPHFADVENGGTNIQSSYGLQPKLTRVAGLGNGKQALELTEETEESILNGNLSTLTYTNTGGPVNIKVIDPLQVPLGDFRLEFHDTTSINDISDSYWTLTNESNDSVVSSESWISVKNEQIIPEWGFSIDVEQPEYPGTNDTRNGFISASMTFADPNKPWLTAIPDADGSSALNWIRSGTTSNGDEFDDQSGEDDEQVYEKVLGGTIAPYRVVSKEFYGPAWNKFQTLNKMDSLNSVKIVITSDQTKWSRCPVLEMADEENLAQGGVKKLNIRAGNSVDKNGNDDGTGTGMGWFPGYAIDLETGDRLNIMFAENSFLEGNNGRDMMWNPTSKVFTTLFEPRFGGMHSIYICNNGSNVPAYDEGAYVRAQLDGSPSDAQKRKVFSDVTWVVGFPLQDDRYDFLATDVEVVLNVDRPYRTHNGAVSGLPEYTFNTSDIQTKPGDNDVAKDALDKINVVPNPYYAYSDYESGQIDNRIRITNTPEKCVIKIFSVNGTLIREIDKDNDLTSQDWDMKNQSGIPVASGLYIIHVDVEGVGEKVLKWFGVMRPIDLDSF